MPRWPRLRPQVRLPRAPSAPAPPRTTRLSAPDARTPVRAGRTDRDRRGRPAQALEPTPVVDGGHQGSNRSRPTSATAPARRTAPCARPQNEQQNRHHLRRHLDLADDRRRHCLPARVDETAQHRHRELAPEDDRHHPRRSAGPSCTSEINAAVTRSLSASGSIHSPSPVTCPRRRARYPSSQSVNDATPKMAAPSISLLTPKTSARRSR